MSELQTVIDTLDHAADAFDGIATAEQKKIYAEVITLAKDLDTDPQGKVKQSVANLKRLTQIKAKLAALSKDKEWVAGITQFAQYFGILQQQQNSYYTDHFPSLTLSTAAKQKHQLMKQLAVQNTMDALMGSGLQANVTDKLNDILLRAVTTGAKFSDLQEELRTHLLGKDGGQGAFARYATTYATTALSQFTGQNNKLLTDDLGCDWFMYVGSNKETTREFCSHLTAKKFVHRSEIPDLLKGKIDDYQCAIYPKTKLPYGMIDGTTPDNFQCNCGGWNCRHQLIPVADAVVPANLRAKFAKNTTTTQPAQPAAKAKIDITPYQKDIEAIKQYAADHPKDTMMQLYLKIIENVDKITTEAVFKTALDESLKIIQKNGIKSSQSKKQNANINNVDPVALKILEDKIKKLEQLGYTDAEIIDLLKVSLSTITQDTKKKAYEHKIKELESKNNPTSSKKNTKDIIDSVVNYNPQSTNNTPQKQHPTIKATEAETIDKVKMLTNTDSQTAKKLYDAARSFTYQWDYEIRQIECGNNVKSKHNHSLEDIAQKANDLEDFIAKSPQWNGAKTYRGMSLSKRELDELRIALKNGTADMKGSASWSTDRKVAEKFAMSKLGENTDSYGTTKDIPVIMIAKGHYKATSIMYLSKFGIDEKEVIASKNCRYRLIEEKRHNGFVIFEAEPSTQVK